MAYGFQAFGIVSDCHFHRLHAPYWCGTLSNVRVPHTSPRCGESDRGLAWLMETLQCLLAVPDTPLLAATDHFRMHAQPQ